MNTYHELAAAMRKGAALRPQAYHRFFRFDLGTCTGSCALGATYEGAGFGRRYDTSQWDIEKRLQPAIQSYTQHPVNGRWDYLPDIISNLNDIHHWPRRKIADWLDTL